MPHKKPSILFKPKKKRKLRRSDFILDTAIKGMIGSAPVIGAATALDPRAGVAVEGVAVGGSVIRAEMRYRKYKKKRKKKKKGKR